MPKAKMDSGVVHIPGLGALVIGGSGPRGKSSTVLQDAEILKFIELDKEEKMTWTKINPLLKPRIFISAAFLNDSVIVSSAGDETMEVLSLPSGQPGQWTLITVGIGECKVPYFLNVYRGNMFVSGNLYTIPLV